MKRTTNCGVYRITLGNGWFYIGSSNDLRKRKNSHLSKLSCYQHVNPKLQAIFDKYGVFEFEVLFECHESELLAKEQTLLDAHFVDSKCANLEPIAGSSRGVKHSDKSKANMSAAQKLRYSKPEQREQARVIHLGHKASPKTKAKQSASQKLLAQTPKRRAHIMAMGKRSGRNSGKKVKV